MPLPPPIALTKFPAILESGTTPLSLKTNKINPVSVSDTNQSPYILYLSTMEVNNAFTDFDREYTSSSNIDSTPIPQKCYACERLEKGEGGEDLVLEIE